MEMLAENLQDELLHRLSIARLCWVPGTLLAFGCSNPLLIGPANPG